VHFCKVYYTDGESLRCSAGSIFLITYLAPGKGTLKYPVCRRYFAEIPHTSEVFVKYPDKVFDGQGIHFFTFTRYKVFAKIPSPGQGIKSDAVVTFIPRKVFFFS
jgi:hypothetical protein